MYGPIHTYRDQKLTVNEGRYSVAVGCLCVSMCLCVSLCVYVGTMYIRVCEGLHIDPYEGCLEGTAKGKAIQTHAHTCTTRKRPMETLTR